MFMLLVCAGQYVYAINIAHVTEVIPMVKIKKIPHVPDYMLGHINFGGKPIPVADLSLIIENRTSCDCMHTRIVLLHSSGLDYPQFGLIAEKVTEVIDLELLSFVDSGVYPADLPFFKGISNDVDVPIQLLDVDKLYGFLQLAPAVER